MTSSRDLTPGAQHSLLTRRQFVEGALKVGVAGGAASFLSGCLFSGHKKTSPPSKLSGRIQILIGFAGGNSTGQRQVQQTLAEQFINAHPEVGIDFLRATSAALAETELKTLIARGQAPDIVLGIDLADLSRLVDQHLWLDLHPFLRGGAVSTAAWLPVARSAAALGTYYGNSSVVPALAVGVHDHALAYNPTLFARAGVAPPPASWDQSSWTFGGAFLDAARRLTIDTAGRASLDASFDPTHIAQFGVARLDPEAMLLSYAGHLYDASNKRATLAGSGAIAGAQFAADLVSRYHVQPTAAQLAALAAASGGAASGSGTTTTTRPTTSTTQGRTTTSTTQGRTTTTMPRPTTTTLPSTPSDPALVAWRAGKLAMIEMCSCEIASGYGMDLPFPVKAAALPSGPARRFCRLEPTLATIVAASTQHQLAFEVLDFFAVNAANERQLAYGGFGTMPALSANLASFGPATKSATGVDPSVWLAGLPGASAEIDAWTPAFTGVQALITSALAKVLSGTPAATVMPQLQAQAQAQIDAWLRTHKLP
ncbi:MAG: ABC transporter substrate-binding protein [Acidimicrobiales bacterium]